MRLKQNALTTQYGIKKKNSNKGGYRDRQLRLHSIQTWLEIRAYTVQKKKGTNQSICNTSVQNNNNGRGQRTQLRKWRIRIRIETEGRDSSNKISTK